VHALAHITGGGLPGNVPRALPPTLDAVIAFGRWPVPAEFTVLADAGGVERGEMLRAFNMGVGMIVIASASLVDRILTSARAANVAAWRVGEVVPGSGRVIIRD
jgi:phosphoribosylformylglycinamidine cyclo-ligase